MARPGTRHDGACQFRPRPCSKPAAWHTFTPSTQWRYCDDHTRQAEAICAATGVWFSKHRIRS